MAIDLISTQQKNTTSSAGLYMLTKHSFITIILRKISSSTIYIHCITERGAFGSPPAAAELLTYLLRTGTSRSAQYVAISIHSKTNTPHIGVNKTWTSLDINFLH